MLTMLTMSRMTVHNVEQVNGRVFPAYGVMHVQDTDQIIHDNDLNVVLVYVDNVEQMNIK